MNKKKYDGNWYERETKKDQIEIESYKNSLIEHFKNVKKEVIFEKPKKQTIWKRIIKSLGL
jgi:hypothetical protein